MGDAEKAERAEEAALLDREGGTVGVPLRGTRPVALGGHVGGHGTHLLALRIIVADEPRG